MQFLSVAARELRVAARKRSSFRVRILTSIIALFVSGFSLWFVTLFGSRPISGSQLFFTLSWVTFFCACIVGPALTADSVNEERNNGTLGLLFLTNLNSASISLGKLVGHGLLALYSVLSVVPVMALAALLGGADAESLAKTALVLFVTLILSLMIGMLSSTVCRKPWVAAALSVSVLAVLMVGPPSIAQFARMFRRANWAPWVELLSPSYSLLMAGPSAAMLPSSHLWLALGVQVAIALVFFGLITFLLPRVWKEGKTGNKTRYFSAMWRAVKYGSQTTRRKLGRRLLQMNPILWLSCREQFGPAGFAAFLLVIAFAISWAGLHVPFGTGPNPDQFLRSMILWIMGLPLLYIAFCFRFATAASERFAVDRKSGALELILCTPLKTREILRGHWLGLARRFWGAALLLFALHAFTLFYIIEAIRILLPLPGFNLSEALLASLKYVLGIAKIGSQVAPSYIACLAVLAAGILIVILWIALGWLGMALSLKLKREILAPWISLILLAVPPLPLFACALPFVGNQKLFSSNLFLGMLLTGATGFFIVLANALIWLFLARRWTYRKLRGTAGTPSSGPNSGSALPTILTRVVGHLNGFR